MKRKVKIFSIIMLIIITLSSFMATISYADLINPNDYNPNNRNEEVPEKFTNMVGIIATTIQTIGVILSIIVIGLLGIKYMTGSVEENDSILDWNSTYCSCRNYYTYSKRFNIASNR